MAVVFVVRTTIVPIHCTVPMLINGIHTRMVSAHHLLLFFISLFHSYSLFFSSSPHDIVIICLFTSQPHTFDGIRVLVVHTEKHRHLQFSTHIMINWFNRTREMLRLFMIHISMIILICIEHWMLRCVRDCRHGEQWCSSWIGWVGWIVLCSILCR